MSTPSYPASTLAKLFGLSERRVRQLPNESIIPAPKGGKYDLAGSVIGYIRYLKSLAQNKRSEDTEEYELKMRILRAQAQTAELGMKKETGEFMPVSQAIADWTDMLRSFRSRILALPYRIACRVAGLREHHEIEKVVKDLVKETLDDMANYDPSTQAEEPTEKVYV